MNIAFNNDISQLVALHNSSQVFFRTKYGKEKIFLGTVMVGKNLQKFVSCDGLAIFPDEISEFCYLYFDEYKERYLGKDSPYEVIKVIQACEVGFNIGNALKYIARADKKGNREADINKCIEYLKYNLAAPIPHDYVHNNDFKPEQVADAWGLDEKLTEALKLIWYGNIQLAIECLSTC